MKVTNQLVLPIKILLLSSFLFSCNTNSVTYEIKENYRGPCLVFIDKYDSLSNYNTVKLDYNGLGKENKEEKSGAISFKIHGDKSELDLIDMPYLESTKSDYFAIYGFFHVNTDSECNKEKGIEFVEFFVGTKSEYINWRNENESILYYLDKKGIDWCKYYKK